MAGLERIEICWYISSPVCAVRWKGQKETVLHCFLLLSLWLKAKIPQNHRKIAPKGGRQWLTVYTVSTHECCWNTNRVAHVRLEQKLRRRMADYSNGGREDVSGLGSLVRWLSRYLNTRQKKTRYCSSSSIWNHFEPHLAGQPLRKSQNSVFTNIPR